MHSDCFSINRALSECYCLWQSALISLTSNLLLLRLRLSSECLCMHMNWHYSVLVHSSADAQLHIKPFVWIEVKCVWGGSWSLQTTRMTHLHVSESRPRMLIGCVQRSGAHINAHTRTHAHTVRCTRGPSEQALVTPYKSI